MPNFTIRSASADNILFSGFFRNHAQCLRAAIQDGVPLSGADLRHADLQNADLDGGDFTNACFHSANLAGANLSEALLHGADFHNTILYGAVLCESDMTQARFDGTLFGGTEITAAILKETRFSSLSAFSLRFAESQTMARAIFTNPGCGTPCPMARPPLVLGGLARPLIVMDRHIKAGHQVFALDSLPARIASGGITPQNIRLRLEQTLLSLMQDDKAVKIA